MITMIYTIYTTWLLFIRDLYYGMNLTGLNAYLYSLDLPHWRAIDGNTHRLKHSWEKSGKKPAWFIGEHISPGKYDSEFDPHRRHQR